MQLKSCCQGKALKQDNDKKIQVRTFTPSPINFAGFDLVLLLMADFNIKYVAKQPSLFNQLAYFIFTGLSPPELSFKS